MQFNRIVLLVGLVTSMFFAPGILIWARILPLPDMVQEQALTIDMLYLIYK